MFRKLSLYILPVFLLLAVTSSNAAEYYFRFNIDTRQELTKLTRLVSIDQVQGDTVYAFANDRQLEQIRQLNYRLEMLAHPGSLIEPKMAASRSDMVDWDAYPTYEAYVSMMYQFEADYPDICRVVLAGNTVQSRELLFVKISDNVDVEEAEPEVQYSSTMHGNETTGYVLTLRLIDSLLSTYGVDPRVTNMINEMEIWINPLANPDGTYRTGNSSVNGAIRYNANFVDLNRNFPDPDDGPHPDGNPWQPETIAMTALAQAHSFVISANFHGGAEVVNYPWDTWPQRHADDDWYQDICREYADSAQAASPPSYMNDLNNGITNGWDWYPIVGGRQDFMNYYHGCRETTIELSFTKLLSASQLPAHWVYNRQALLGYFEQALYGIRGIVTSSVTSLPVSATISVNNHDVDSSEVYTDPNVGDYYRMIAPGTYSLTFTAAGYVAQTVYSVTVTDGGVVVVNIQMDELPNNALIEFVDDDAGEAFPGDNISLNVTLINNGGGNANSVGGTLSTNDPNVNITTDGADFPALSAVGGIGQSVTPYLFTIFPLCPVPHMVDFDLIVTADGGYLDTLSFTFTVGLDIENFESGDFSSYGWQSSGNQAWFIDGSNMSEGAYSARSGVITHLQSSSMEVTLDYRQADAISFDYKVSSEANWDFLRFYIDDVEAGAWAGSVEWSAASYAVSGGSHTFRWTYTKDQSVSTGSDAAWVDRIVFPLVASDIDADGVNDYHDNCFGLYNPDQLDPDLDSVGSLCDNCPDDYNPGQEDSDNDGLGDACDGCCVGIRGNVDDDPEQLLDIIDVITLVDFLFHSGPDPQCMDEANVDGLGGEIPDIIDILYLVNYLFLSGSPPPSCF